MKIWLKLYQRKTSLNYFFRAEWSLLVFPLTLQKRAPLFVLGMSACRYVTVLYASLPFMEELNPRMWNVPLPNLEFLLRGSRSEWTDRGSPAQTDWSTLWGSHAGFTGFQPCRRLFALRWTMWRIKTGEKLLSPAPGCKNTSVISLMG